MYMTNTISQVICQNNVHVMRISKRQWENILNIKVLKMHGNETLLKYSKQKKRKYGDYISLKCVNTLLSIIIELAVC